MNAPIGPGTLILVVGPSGAGKDTMITLARAAAGNGYRFARRVVTRVSNLWEDHDTMSPAEFERLEAGGEFVLSWRAHGLAYGLPRAIAEDIRAGLSVVCNVSRGVVGEARRRFAHVRVIYVDADPALRAARIAARGRDQPAGSRGTTAGPELRPADCDCVIDNSGDVDEAAAAFTSALRRFGSHEERGGDLGDG